MSMSELFLLCIILDRSKHQSKADISIVCIASLSIHSLSGIFYNPIAPIETRLEDKMASFPIDTQHDDMIHDSQFDYYSKRMATCSSDRTIKIFDITGNIHHNSATLTGHDGPVWQVAWAHPKFGVILASCSYDGTVIIHREATQNSWSKVYEHKFHESSVNSISWAPHEFGLILACASSDGKVSILEYKDENWVCSSIQNDTLGCNTVTWGPFSALGSLLDDGSSTQRLATGSCDNMVRMYKLQNGKWEEEAKESSPHAGMWSCRNGKLRNLYGSCS